MEIKIDYRTKSLMNVFMWKEEPVILLNANTADYHKASGHLVIEAVKVINKKYPIWYPQHLKMPCWNHRLESQSVFRMQRCKKHCPTFNTVWKYERMAFQCVCGFYVDYKWFSIEIREWPLSSFPCSPPCLTNLQNNAVVEGFQMLFWFMCWF